MERIRSEEETLKKYHDITNISIDNRALRLRVDGVDRVFPLQSVSDKLSKASQARRETYEISPSGYGIHWPFLEEDISIDGLLKIRHEPSRNRRSSNPVSSSSR
jgi:hypothetical protein